MPSNSISEEIVTNTVDARAENACVLDRIRVFLRRFVFLKQDSVYLLVAAWIVATHLYKRFDYVGYLFAYSPEPQSGKTTLLDILDLLVANSSGVQISPSEAVLFRTASGHTQLFDEVDNWKNPDDLRSVLNAGYQRGKTVTRCSKVPRKDFKPETYDVFGPRALAGIGLHILEKTTLDRAFAIAMVRQKKDEKRERLKQARGTEQEQLRAEIAKWAADNGDAVQELCRKSEFPYLQNFSDRTIDIAEPLAAIVEVAYPGSIRKKIASTRLVEAIASTRVEQQTGAPDIGIIRDLLHLTSESEPLIGNASELAAQLGNVENPPDQHRISNVLRKYGFKTKSTRLEGTDSPRQRYVLDRDALREVLERWGSAEKRQEQPDQPLEPRTESVSMEGSVVAVVGDNEYEGE